MTADTSSTDTTNSGGADAPPQSDIEIERERAARAEERADKAERDALRSRVQARHGISDEDATLLLTGTDEATLTAQAERLASRAAEERVRTNVVPREGPVSYDAHRHPAGDEREFVRELFSSPVVY